MFKMRKKGDWMMIQTMFRRRQERLDALRRRIVRGVVEEFEKEVKAPLPQTEEMTQYAEAIGPREVRGSMKDGELAYDALR